MAVYATIAGCQRGYQKNKNKNEKKKISVNRLTPVLLLLTMISFSGIFYVFRVNQMATAGYEMKEMEKNIQKLSKLNERLKIEVAELQSITNLENQKEALGMIRPMEVDYLEIDETVAIIRTD